MEHFKTNMKNYFSKKIINSYRSKIIFLSFLFFYLTPCLKAQKQVRTTNLAWYDMIIQFPLNQKWSIYGEYGHRRINMIRDLNQQLFIIGLIRNLNSEVNVTFGLANFHNDINPSYSFKNRPEYRSFQFIKIGKSLGSLQTQFRLRIEQRRNQESTDSDLLQTFVFNHRVGYRIKAQFPISNDLYNNTLLFGEIGNETMVNYGKNVELNTFDQSRLYGGILVKWSQKCSTHLTLMYLYQQKNNGTDFSEQYIIRFSQKIVL